MSNENQIKADAIYGFVNNMIDALETGFIDHANPTLAQVHRVAQNHCKDYYGIDMPSLEEQWGEETARACAVVKNSGGIPRGRV